MTRIVVLAFVAIGCSTLGSAPLVLTEVPNGEGGKALVRELAVKHGCKVDTNTDTSLTLRCKEGTLHLPVLAGPPTFAIRCLDGDVSEKQRCSALVREILLAEADGPSAALARATAKHAEVSAQSAECPTGSVLVPGGQAWLGAADDSDALAPTRQLIPSICVDRTEVTVVAYRACVSAGRCTEPESRVLFPGFGPPEPMRAELSRFCNAPRGDRENHPLNCVDQPSARSYCAWKGGRLAREEEWEHAARGPEGGSFPWGGETPRSGSLLCWDRRDGAAGTCAVGAHPGGASVGGLLDMAGNVWEWTESKGQLGPVARGGGWTSYMPRYVRATTRWSLDPATRLNCLGIRCVYDLPSPGR